VRRGVPGVLRERIGEGLAFAKARRVGGSCPRGRHEVPPAGAGRETGPCAGNARRVELLEVRPRRGGR